VIIGIIVSATTLWAHPPGTALPADFYEEAIAAGLRLPTSFAVAPDGRIFITEKRGRVRVVHQGALQEGAFIDLSAEVNSSADRGLMAVAVHPRFPSQPFVYLAYTYDPPEARSYPAGGARVARILRVEADRNNLNVHKPGSGVVILGTNSIFEHIGNPEQGDAEPFSCFETEGGFVPDCVPTEGTGHTIDFMKFGRDGSLFVAVGDGIVNSKGNWRAQNVNSLAGKILRIDPLTGNGLASNPFFDGDPTSNRSKVYALGMRNPYRFTIHPTSGQLVLGDVGNTGWEEINRGGAGANFGWPCFEGQERAASFPICDPVFNGASPVVFGVYTYPHQSQPPRGAVIGGDFYTGRNYPGRYRNAYFFTDFNGGVIYTMNFASDGTYTLDEFATSAPGPVQITMGPDGNLWMLYIATGELVRLRYGGVAVSGSTSITPTTSARQTPTAVFSTTPGTPAPSSGATGKILYETWSGVSGVQVSDLTRSPNYPDNPSARTLIESLDAPRSGAPDTGHRIRGYLHPRVSGRYQFWIASDDASELYLSSDDNPMNKTLIASVPEWTPLQVWDKFPQQASVLIELEKGRRYYVEALHKQGDQKENLSVAWQPPGGVREIVGGAYLSPWGK
jgi:glucose/arabinose dehydrogenase